MSLSSDPVMADERRSEADRYRRVSQDVWEAMAPGWERWRPQLADALTPVCEWLVSELAPHPGQTLLELGAGVGDTGFAAAANVGERGRLISSDFSPAMVAVARRRGTQLGLRNVDYQVIDAEHIELDADSVDGVLCQSGYMLTADPATALAETRRVLRPGGRLALSVWGAPERNPWASIGAMILVERGHMPAPQPGGARSLQPGRPGAHKGPARRRRLRLGAHRRGAGALSLPRPRRLRAMGRRRGGPIRDGRTRPARGRA